MGFSLRVNHKKRAGASHPNRDEQFQHITELRERCAADNVPVISVDIKKKELVGAFRNPGAKWDHSPERVNDHVRSGSPTRMQPLTRPWAAAYGWPTDISDDDVLRELLARNGGGA